VWKPAFVKSGHNYYYYYYYYYYSLLTHKSFTLLSLSYTVEVVLVWIDKQMIKLYTHVFFFLETISVNHTPHLTLWVVAFMTYMYK